MVQAETLMELYLKTDEQMRNPASISFGTYSVIVPCYRRVLFNGKPLELTRRKFDLLRFLAWHPRYVFNRNQLYEQV